MAAKFTVKQSAQLSGTRGSGGAAEEQGGHLDLGDSNDHAPASQGKKEALEATARGLMKKAQRREEQMMVAEATEEASFWGKWSGAE